MCDSPMRQTTDRGRGCFETVGCDKLIIDVGYPVSSSRPHILWLAAFHYDVPVRHGLGRNGLLKQPVKE